MKRAFTLIELLVVIAIIGVLSNIVLASLNTARMKARDSKRVSDAQEIRKALELYYDDYGHYPAYVDSAGDSGWDNSSIGDGFITGLTGSNVRGDNPTGKKYMSVMPQDPQQVSTDSLCAQSYAYLSSPNSTYNLLIHPESSALKGFTYDPSMCPGINTIRFTQ